MKHLILFALLHTLASAADHITLEPRGEPKGKHIVFLAADDEYRSEEGLPMLAQILSHYHGFKCTVCWSVDEHGVITPTERIRIGNPAALDSADAIVIMFRWRIWTPEGREKFQAAMKRGVPIIGLRTATHCFDKEAGEELFTFSKRVLGEQWLSHWGVHKKEATRGLIEPANAAHPVLSGVGDIFGNTDVYEAYPPADATILLRGQVLAGMTPDSPPADYSKKRLSDGQTQNVNAPMMPIAWVREMSGQRIFMTTMGAATDLASEGLSRLIVNGIHWSLHLDVPANADVTPVQPYTPTMYGFGSFKPRMKPEDYLIK